MQVSDPAACAMHARAKRLFNIQTSESGCNQIVQGAYLQQGSLCFVCGSNSTSERFGMQQTGQATLRKQKEVLMHK